MHEEQKNPHASGSRHSGRYQFRMQRIAESIILQSIEDLWEMDECRGSLHFFRQNGFSDCAFMADMGIFEQVMLLDMVNSAIHKSCGYSRRPGDGPNAAP
jgi:hypothetical protein